ncbi:MAG: YbaB/EbfC family nucleoid-associated protein [Candidatus Enteromonas sp.]|nr:YbaB/EbfC family nucleoid-associated protein [bacterium]MDD6916998.1 YbaB/EbfC family nucleoid-associated protein [bacterium]MDY6100675.1 YbaB/EbfC family nucleoid-associated protein [Candidatus Enteromonas sp.]
MNQMQQMFQQAQRMQRELQKAHAELESREFKVEKSGMVEAIVMGDRSIKSLNIDKDALDPENKEMLEEAITLALNDAFQQINKANEEIEEKITGQRGLF